MKIDDDESMTFKRQVMALWKEYNSMASWRILQINWLREVIETLNFNTLPAKIKSWVREQLFLSVQEFTQVAVIMSWLKVAVLRRTRALGNISH